MVRDGADDGLPAFLHDDAFDADDLRHGAAAAVAAQLHQQEAAVVPPHLREPPRELPPGVVRMCGGRARLANSAVMCTAAE